MLTQCSARRLTRASALVTVSVVAVGLLAGCQSVDRDDEDALPADRLSASEIYARVSPSVAYVETPLGSGTGVLIDDDLLLTNAHVLWPFAEARVVFSDASELIGVPVLAQDLLADLALLDLSLAGGAPRSAAPAAIGNDADLAVGDDVYLVGYPAEVEAYPQPAITSGLLSRRRHWVDGDLPVLQTDAAIAGGQSGGALVAPDGSVIGITSMIFGEGEFGLALSASRAVERLYTELVSDIDGTAPRALPSDAGKRSIESALDSTWDEAVFVLEGVLGDDVDLSVTSPSDARLVALSPYGDLDLDMDETANGREGGSVRLLETGPYFVVVTLDEPGAFAITSTTTLRQLDDPDDGASLTGGAYVGQMDFPGDIDYITLDLERGGEVTVTVDTLSFVPDVLVYHAEDTGMSSPIADALIGGALGMTAGTTLEAAEGGRFVIVVRDFDGLGTGAYSVKID